MKTFILSVCLAFGAITLYQPVIAAEEKKVEEKRVCIDQKDKDGNVIKDKDGKAKQTCKMVKVHKKLEGTEVPGQKK